MQTTGLDVHLLIVEDSEEDTLLLVREIRRGGLNPVWERVHSVATLNHALLRGAWDAVLSDDALPQMNGLTALAMVRAQYPELPFFLVAGSLPEDLAGAAIDAGATDCFSKSRLARLVPALRRELRVARERMALRERDARLSAFQQTQVQFRRVAHEAPVGLWLTDLSGGCVFANRRWCEMTGLTEDQIRGRAWVDVVHPEDRDRFVAEWNRAVREGSEFVMDYRLQTPGGRVTHLKGRSVILKDEAGRVSGYHGTAIDHA